MDRSLVTTSVTESLHILHHVRAEHKIDARWLKTRGRVYARAGFSDLLQRRLVVADSHGIASSIPITLI